jgi:hypothetical protein
VDRTATFDTFERRKIDHTSQEVLGEAGFAIGHIVKGTRLFVE